MRDLSDGELGEETGVVGHGLGSVVCPEVDRSVDDDALFNGINFIQRVQVLMAVKICITR